MQPEALGSSNDIDYDILIKVIIVGDSGVGKSNMVTRFLKNQFTLNTKSTIGVDFGVKKIELDEEVIAKVQLWDTAGQERYRAVVGSYYKNAHGAVIVYDISNRASFHDLEKWLQELKEHTSPDCKVMVVGNKKDLVSKREVPQEHGEEFAKKNGLFFMETSAKEEAGNVKEAFMFLMNTISKELIEKDPEGNNQARKQSNGGSKKVLDVKKQENDKKGCC